MKYTSFFRETKLDRQRELVVPKYRKDATLVVPKQGNLIRWVSVTALVLLGVSVLVWQLQEVATGMLDWETIKLTLKGIRSGYENFILAITTAHGVPCYHGNTGGITL